MNRIEVAFPMITKSELNMCEHWGTKHRRRKSQRELTRAMLHNHLLGKNFNGCTITVTFTRIATKKLDEGDNLSSAFKAIRDEVADMIGIDDGSDRYEWVYKQEVIKKVKCGVRIKIEWRAGK